MYMYMCLSLSLSIYIYIYTHISIYLSIYDWPRRLPGVPAWSRGLPAGS